MQVYVALLRGINVGGKNIIKMPALTACFETLGFMNVSTYIQSGNVIFCVDEDSQDILTSSLESTLSKAFNYESNLVLRSLVEMKAIVANAPEGFGRDTETYRYDVLFLKKPLVAEEAILQVSTRPGVDQAFAANGVLYFSRLISRASQSYLTRIISLPIYQSMTVRNWNTTSRLLSMMEAVAHARLP